VIDAVLRVPVFTPNGLAAQLGIAPQTATALLRDLRAAKLVTEVTGRRSFRAFAVPM
jgi:DNA-binding MarR family transcriptional regulator